MAYIGIPNTQVPGVSTIWDGQKKVWFDPRKHYTLFDDFPSGIGTQSYTWDTSASGTGAGVTSNVDASSTHPGVVAISTGTDAGGGCGFRLNPSASGMYTTGAGSIYCEWLCKLSALSDGTNTYTARIGMGDTNGITIFNNGMFFSYTDGTNSGKWQIINANGGAYTTGNTNTLADTNYHKFAISVNAAGTSVAYFIDDVQVANSPLAANITTNPFSPHTQIVKSAGATARIVYADYCYLFINLTTAR